MSPCHLFSAILSFDRIFFPRFTWQWPFGGAKLGLWHCRVLRSKPQRFAPCPELPACCKLQVPLHSRGITLPISLGKAPTTNVRAMAVRRPSWDKTLCHSHWHVINSLFRHQSGDLTTSIADGGPAGKQGAVPWAAAPHRVHPAGESEATSTGVPYTLDWTPRRCTSGWNPNVVHDWLE